MKWVTKEGYIETETNNYIITIEKRPIYCDRGNFLAKVFEKPGVFMDLDAADGWPRYYMSLQRAKLEIAEWVRKREGK